MRYTTSMFSIDIAIAHIFGAIPRVGIISALIATIGTYLIYIIGVIAIVLWFREKDIKKRIYVVLITIVVEVLSRGIITETIRALWHRARPFVSLGFEPLISGKTSPSFPSGHTVFAVTLALCIFILNKKWGWISLGLAGLIMVARVAAGVHWVSDVVGGALIALVVWAVTMSYIGPKQILKTEKKEPEA